MGKKTKSKERLDQYYHFAKTQGYRSRAAYKLIQLNRKYNLLNNASVVVDLCAAPGGWMQVCANTMPPNSTIVGVDLVQIKRVQGTTSFKGDITKQQTYERLRKQLKGRKCDAVLNDGAPNVGSDWNKDAYTQSELVLAAFKLSCDFLKEGGYFVTKIFRSTDTDSLMWALKKFFTKVQMTKPKASRFSSAETFIVGVGYSAPTFIDEKYFDPKYIFKDTIADHFHDQMAGQITSIDKLLENRRKRGGYEDNAPMHLYKQVSLSKFVEAEAPLLILAQYNRILITPQQKSEYFDIWKKMPIDMQELLADLKVLGKRDISLIIKWRGKIRQYLHKNKAKSVKSAQSLIEQEIEQFEEQEIQGEQKIEEEQEDNSDKRIEEELLNRQKKQIREHRKQQNKKSELLIKAQAANQQLLKQDAELGEDNLESLIGDEDIEKLGFQEASDQQKPEKLPKYITLTNKEMEANLEQMYELKKQKRDEKMEHAREIRRNRKDRQQQRNANVERKLKSRRFGPDQQENEEEPKQNYEAEQHDFHEFKFKNPLAAMDDEDLYISENEEQYNDQPVDPDEKMSGELSDDDAYVIPKAETDMERRRKKIKKNQDKKKKKLHKDIEDGEDVGGQIEIVKQKTMENYDIDSLTETLVIAKKMLRNQSREDIIDSSYGRFNFQDHEELPNWFSEDEKKHNFKSLPITKEQYNREKERLMAINARVPKKILEAKVRRKIRVQKKLKKTQKKAETLMSQEGINEVSKLRQIGKMYDKSKRELKDQKKYVVGKKTKAVGGKDSRKVKHVDARLKKDKHNQKKKIKKTRQVKRSSSKRGKF